MKKQVRLHPDFTNEEIQIERNRRKCLNYQTTHRAEYRKYQREYKKANYHELKNVRYRLTYKIKTLESNLEQAIAQLALMDAEIASRPQEDQN